MKCQKCGFVSFDYLSECKKCGVNLEASRNLLGLMDIKPAMPLFLGAMLTTASAGANATGPGKTSAAAPNGMGFGEIEFGPELEFEIEDDSQSAPTQHGKSSDLESISQIELPEDFTLTLGEEEKSDEFELVIGPDFDETLTLELDAKDLEDQSPSESVSDDLKDMQIEDVVLDFSSEASPEGEIASELDALSPELELDISLEPDSTEDLSNFETDQMSSGSTNGDDNLVMDFSQNDLENLLLELDDAPTTKNAGQGRSEQS